ncbi:unnamed protein product [Gadus morhua 'NCC']
MEGESEHEEIYTPRNEPLILVDGQAEVLGGGGDDDNTAPPAIHVTEERGPDQLEDAIVAAPAGGTTSVIDNELDARSLGDAETSASSSQAPDVAMVSHEDQDNRLSLSDGLLEEHTLQTQPSPQLTSHFTGIENRVSEPCWYCLRSLEPEHRPHDPGQPDVMVLQHDYNSVTPVPPSGQKVNYQTDPRPHFGVAYSSRSTALPLWGSEGPSWVIRNQDLVDQNDTCPHCHIALPPDTLRWHEAKCLLFDGFKSIVNN